MLINKQYIVDRQLFTNCFIIRVDRQAIEQINLIINAFDFVDVIYYIDHIKVTLIYIDFSSL